MRKPSSLDKETLGLIHQLVWDRFSGKQAELVGDLIETAIRLGKDNASAGDLKLITRAVRELRFAAKVFSRYHGIPKVAVFGSARTRPEADEYQLAIRFSRRIVEAGYMVITGGGDGIMGAAQEGAGAEKSFGLNIRLPFEQRANETIDGDPKLINFNYFFTRKLNFVKETQAFVLFPGGFGTHDEGCEVLTLMQTGKAPIVPVILMDRPNGHYWETWRRFVQNDLLEQGLISASDFHLFRITHDVEDAVREIGHFYQNYHSYRWVRERMVVRIKKRISPAALAELNARFDPLLAADRIVQTVPLPEERDETTLADHPRLVLVPHKRDFGQIRLFLNAINDAETVD